jgi:hypothetical protein
MNKIIKKGRLPEELMPILFLEAEDPANVRRRHR